MHFCTVQHNLKENPMTTNRRTFVIQTVLGAGALASVSNASAQSALAESDPQAVALGYKVDAAKADKSKFPKYAAGQSCAKCGLFQGKGADTVGGCPLFAGKTVTAKGWCSAYVAKP
jgi:hypothetical protein